MRTTFNSVATITQQQQIHLLSTFLCCYMIYRALFPVSFYYLTHVADFWTCYMLGKEGQCKK